MRGRDLPVVGVTGSEMSRQRWCQCAPEVTSERAVAAMPPAALIARSLLRSAARPGPAPRGLKSGPPQSPVGLGVSSGGAGAAPRGDLGGGRG